jgi:hypothetical protein
MAITNKEINLSQLDAALGSQGLVADLTDSENKIIKPADNSTITEAKLEAAIKSHIAVDEAKANANAKAAAQAKLAALGLTVEDLQALGL